MFLPFRPTVPGPGRQHNEPFLAQVFSETTLSFASLEPLIDFLAYLEPELRLKTAFLTKIKKLQEKGDLPSNSKLGQL